LHLRLLRAVNLPGLRLILECFHPSASLSTPYLYCDYLYTDSFQNHNGVSADTSSAGARSNYSDDDYALNQQSGRGISLGSIYTHFRPVVQEENRRPRARYATQNSLQTQAQGMQGVNASGEGNGESGLIEERPPFQDVYLDENVLWTQLRAYTNLVKIGPKPGLFLSHVNVSEGIIRVWRDWLAFQSAEGRAEPGDMADGVVDNGQGEDLGPATTSRASERTRQPVLWADGARNVGLRFRVAKKDMGMSQSQRPILVEADYEPPVSYRLEFEELLVRSPQLLLAAEKSEEQEVATSGKALIIAM